MTQRPRPGRPRHAPASGPADATPREQILDAAAALFAERGFAATTTRLIAERVGIRQASLYYHFAGKDELLIELLTTSVRPSLDAVRRIEGLVPGAASAAAVRSSAAATDEMPLSSTSAAMIAAGSVDRPANAEQSASVSGRTPAKAGSWRNCGTPWLISVTSRRKRSTRSTKPATAALCTAVSSRVARCATSSASARGRR